MKNNREKGSIYEQKTKEYLESQNYEILKMNYHCHFGEIDIIAMKEGELVFVEVKYRRSKKYGHPSEAVDYYKQKKIVQVAKWFMMENKLFQYNVRFDVAVFVNQDIKYYKGAFRDE